MEMDRTHKSVFYASTDSFLNPNRNSIKFTAKCNLFSLSSAIALHPFDIRSYYEKPDDKSGRVIS